MAGPGRLPLDSSTRHIPAAPPAQSNDMSLPTAHISRRGSVLPHGLDSLHGLTPEALNPARAPSARPPHDLQQIQENRAEIHYLRSGYQVDSNYDRDSTDDTSAQRAA